MSHDAQATINTAALAAGRDPRDIAHILQLVGSLTDDTTPVQRPRSGPGAQPIRANSDRWAASSANLFIEQGFTAINFIPERDA